MTLTRDVGRYLHSVGEPDSGYLAQRRIGLLGRHGPDLGTDAPFLRRTLVLNHPVFQRIKGKAKRRRFGLLDALFSPFTYQLVDSWQPFPPALQFKWMSLGSSINLVMV
jgi:hypothetical protein